MRKLLVALLTITLLAAPVLVPAGNLSKDSLYPYTASDHDLRLAYDASDNVEYVGIAEPGTATSAAAWQIKKLTYTDGAVTAVDFADGTNAYIKVWDDRATYTY